MFTIGRKNWAKISAIEGIKYMEFRKYEKIHRLGKEETDGILDGPVVVQEKIDGANTSIYAEPTGHGFIIQCCSRNRILGSEDFNGFVGYVRSNLAFLKLFVDHPQWRLYGEWLVKHTIQYKETAYRQWYLFDIFDEETEEYLSDEIVHQVALEFGLNEPHNFGVFKIKTKPELDALMKLVGQSTLGEKGEGIVIKRPGFRNQFGDHCYAKLVHEGFMEDNAVTFGGNNKFSPDYWEIYVVNKFMTLARVQKVLNKIQPEINERLDMKHIPRVCSTSFHDLITEEAWWIAQNVQKLDFKNLQRIAYKKAKQIFVDILNDSISVADQR